MTSERTTLLVFGLLTGQAIRDPFGTATLSLARTSTVSCHPSLQDHASPSKTVPRVGFHAEPPPSCLQYVFATLAILFGYPIAAKAPLLFHVLPCPPAQSVVALCQPLLKANTKTQVNSFSPIC